MNGYGRIILIGKPLYKISAQNRIYICSSKWCQITA